MSMRAIAFAITLLFTGISVADETGITCEDASGDPQGHFMLLGCERHHDREVRHEFRLKDRRTGAVVWSYSFARSAEALWSPDGTALAVTDYAGSNIAELFLIFPERPQRTVNIQNETTRNLGLLPSVVHNDHVYFEAVRWKDAETLMFRIWGQGDHDP